MQSLPSFSLQPIILTVFLLCITTKVHSSTLGADIEVLRLFKQSIDPVSIPAYSYIYSWDFSVDPCESSGAFLGILCKFPLDNSSIRIMAIDLDAIGYDGFLSPSIGNLSELSTLSLGRNNFRGPIPETIGNLQKLTRLSLAENLFTGRIPPAITKLKILDTLDLSQNHLSGSIPTNITILRSLTHLSFANNALSGRIPDLTGLWQLNTLDLGNNQLHGNLPKLPLNLKILSLKRNILSGHLSPLKSLHHLTSFDVSDNRLSGIIGQELLTLPMVTQIDVSVNQLTAIEAVRVPHRESQLQELDAHGNELRGRLPIGLVSLENLAVLDLSHNRFFGPIPREYGSKVGTSWKTLFLANNFLSGNLPPEFISSATTIRGSLANNCLKCPATNPLCRGGQKSNSECVSQNARR
ncbi:hypothetical protein Tsubulata_027242 [Turnera subulata]|uniref:Leucine-rich repeat-containing N-terminal plant-type domain-containing protein n=1 Tax=Turnera subulata TaxID=218843 RepID=A0A9Q0F0B3_9ROSI|nr:hypothetical protein Tsubulata_027242 [Turnera subulata]